MGGLRPAHFDSVAAARAACVFFSAPCFRSLILFGGSLAGSAVDVMERLNGTCGWRVAVLPLFLETRVGEAEGVPGFFLENVPGLF